MININSILIGAGIGLVSTFIGTLFGAWITYRFAIMKFQTIRKLEKQEEDEKRADERRKEEEKRSEEFRKLLSDIRWNRNDREQLHDTLHNMNRMLSNIHESYDTQYNQLQGLINTFQAYSRMAWTRLTPHEEKIVARARITFETIPNFVLEEKKVKDPYALAQILRLLGVSSFYSNDIEAAVKYLETALDIYAKEKVRSQDLYPRAFCSHFLGLIEKNWHLIDYSTEANLAKAAEHLKDANRLLADRRGKFLTPLILSEVLSYSESTRDEARILLENIIEQLRSIRTTTQVLDENHNNLLGRAYLLRGNLDFIDNKSKEAIKWYQLSADQVEQNYFALLSMALANPVDKAEEKMKLYQKGLAALEASDALRKKENVVRVIAIAWAAVAAHELADQQKRDQYCISFQAAGTAIRAVGHRVLLFFCPITKNLVSFEELSKNIKRKNSIE